MGFASFNDVLVHARKNGYAVGAFEFWSLDSAQAIIEAAEELNMPVMLQAGPLECQFAGSAKKLAGIAKIAAEGAKVPVVLHLDHGDTYELACEAIDAGFSSVMIDASHLPYDENVKLTKKVVAAAKSAGVDVEAELGKLAGAEGNVDIKEEEAAQTDPDEAKNFVEETGIDALAVAIGTAHGFYKFVPKINIQRLKSIAEKVSIPLVLHGGSGTPEDKVIEAVKCGIAKINICTEFVAAYGKGYSDIQSKPGFKYSVPSLFGPGKAYGKEVAAAKIRFFKELK